MFSAPLVIDAFVGAFDDGPDAFYAIRGDQLSNVLAALMVYRFMCIPQLQTSVGIGFVGVYGRAIYNGKPDFVLDDCFLSAGNGS